ncbi:MAG TPA: PAS domain S-box protein [Chloroflexota bacterium]|nr:PAS domain S-box protein [Chloroflexota bacterium]
MNQRLEAVREYTGGTSELGCPEDLRRLLDSVGGHAILLLDPRGQIAAWNEWACHLHGYEAAEVVGQPFSCLYSPEDIERGKPARDLEAAARDGRLEEEGWRAGKDGLMFWAGVVITALHGENGALRGFGAVWHDLTQHRRAEAAQAQRAAGESVARRAQELLDISTPVVRVWEGIMLAPIIGLLDSQRTQQLLEKLLQAIIDTGSSVALVDITGVPAIDTQTASHLIESIAAVRLIGADVILTGVRPAIAQTLVHLGIDLTGVNTRASLAAGLHAAIESLKPSPRA